MNENYNEFVPNVHFELIPIKDLVSNQEYQRKLSMYHVEKAVEDFDLNQINPVKVSRRDGVNYVFNGQHTAEIVAKASGSRETPVWCMIYDDLEYEQEADIFAHQMTNVKPLQPLEIFKANCEAGNEKELVIKGLVESYDLKVTAGNVPGSICAVGALENIFDRYGYDMLDKVLHLIIITWEGEQKSFSANMLNAVARLIYSYGNELKEDVFKEKLGTVSMKEISKLAKERRPGSLGYAEAILLFYSKRMKNPPSWGKLYMTKQEREKAMVTPIQQEEALPEASQTATSEESKNIQAG